MLGDKPGSLQGQPELSTATFSPVSGFITLIFYMVNIFGVCIYMSIGTLSLTLGLNSFSCPVSSTVSTPQSLGYRHRQADIPGFLC